MFLAFFNCSCKEKIVLKDFETNNDLAITTEFNTLNPIFGITIGYKLIPLIVMLIWFIMGIFLIPDCLKVGMVLPLSNSVLEGANIIAYFVFVILIFIALIWLTDRIFYRNN